MFEKRIKVVIADDNQEFAEILKTCIDIQSDMEVVGVGRNGLEACSLIKALSPDIAIVDIIMPHLDGLGVLEKIGQTIMENKPMFVMLSAVGQDKITQRAIMLGAEYYIVKPFDMDILITRIRQLYSLKSQYEIPEISASLTLAEEYADMDVETYVTTIMHDIGVPAHIKGYQYLRDAIIRCSTDMDIINSVTKILYPSIAKEFSSTPTRVERSIRNAIEIAWSRGRVDMLDSIFGYTVNLGRGKPTNSEFIAIIADKVRLDSRVAVK